MGQDLLNNKTEVIDSQINKLNFKRSFWLIFSAIVVMQVAQFLLTASYGFDLEKFPPEFYLYAEIGSIIWFIALVIIVIYDMRIQNMPFGKIFNFDISIAKERTPQVIKYFAGCALFVLAVSFLTTGTELQLEYQTTTTIFLTLITTVILAPICEEMVFRGYLYTSMFSSFKRKRERMIVNAMLFAGAHVFLIEFIVGATVPYYIFVLGYLLAKLYEESRSVMPCIILHSLNNSMVFGIDIIKSSYLA